jgi:hypothetical protein
MAGSSLHRLWLQGAAIAAGTRISPQTAQKEQFKSIAYGQNALL